MITEHIPAPFIKTPRLGERIPLSVFLFLALLATVSGCDRDQLPISVRQRVEVSALPENVSAAAKKALPGVRLNDAWKNLDRDTGKLHSYEVRGKANSGKIREVRVSPTGEILEIE